MAKKKHRSYQPNPLKKYKSLLTRNIKQIVERVFVFDVLYIK